MQISNLVNQYNNNLASGGEVSTKSQGVEQLVSTVQKLTAGQVFEGTVNSIKGNTVILGLSSGQNITATLAKDILLEQGQSVFFQVKQYFFFPFVTAFFTVIRAATTTDIRSVGTNFQSLDI